MSPVEFPGLGLTFHIQRIAIQLFGREIYWYGIMIACGFLLAAVFCSKQAHHFGIPQDALLDMLLFALPIGIISARVYYVLFNAQIYFNPDGSFSWKNAVAIWDGGIAIYGGIIGGALTCLFFCHVRRLPFLAMADLASFGLLIGQSIGRWGNFVNQEAYGGACTMPWRMGLEVNGQYITVHPTFLYESLWNVLGFCILFFLLKKLRTFDGELFLYYLLWYGLGRFWIEGLRTDSLYLFQTGIRVSQLVAALSIILATIFLLRNLVFVKHRPEQLWVNRAKEAYTNQSNTKKRRKSNNGNHH